MYGGGIAVHSHLFVRSLASPRQPRRLGGTSRNAVLLFLFPSATIKITYVLHWVIRPWLSHVFIRLIGHKALVSKGDKSAPIVGRCDQYIQWSWVERIKHREVQLVEAEDTHGCVWYSVYR